MEIRLSFDTTDPPAGRLRLMPASGGPGEPGEPGEPGGPAPRTGLAGAREVAFCGWLGLLRALYEVTGSPASGAPGWP